MNKRNRNPAVQRGSSAAQTAADNQQLLLLQQQEQQQRQYGEVDSSDDSEDQFDVEGYGGEEDSGGSSSATTAAEGGQVVGAGLIRKPRAERRASLGGKWAPAEDEKLRELVREHGARNWKHIAQLLGETRSDVQCLHRWNKVLRPGLQKGSWSQEEDDVVRAMVLNLGMGNIKWSTVAAQLPGRIGKQCRERWFNHLDPEIKRGDWCREEEVIIYEAQRHFGNRWCEISKLLKGRTENAVKNRWNSCSMKKWRMDRQQQQENDISSSSNSSGDSIKNATGRELLAMFKASLAASGVALELLVSSALPALVDRAAGGDNKNSSSSNNNSSSSQLPPVEVNSSETDIAVDVTSNNNSSSSSELLSLGTARHKELGVQSLPIHLRPKPLIMQQQQQQQQQQYQQLLKLHQQQQQQLHQQQQQQSQRVVHSPTSAAGAPMFSGDDSAVAMLLHRLKKEGSNSSFGDAIHGGLNATTAASESARLQWQFQQQLQQRWQQQQQQQQHWQQQQRDVDTSVLAGRKRHIDQSSDQFEQQPQLEEDDEEYEEEGEEDQKGEEVSKNTPRSALVATHLRKMSRFQQLPQERQQQQQQQQIDGVQGFVPAPTTVAHFGFTGNAAAVAALPVEASFAGYLQQHQSQYQSPYLAAAAAAAAAAAGLPPPPAAAYFPGMMPPPHHRQFYQQSQQPAHHRQQQQHEEGELLSLNDVLASAPAPRASLSESKSGNSSARNDSSGSPTSVAMRRLARLNSSSSGSNSNGSSIAAAEGVATADGTSAVDRVDTPIGCLKYFRFLNNDSQRSLMRQLLARLQRTYSTPRFISLRTPKNLLTTATTATAVANDDTNDDYDGSGGGDDDCDDNGIEFTNIFLPGGCSSTEGNSWDPNCFEENDNDGIAPDAEADADGYEYDAAAASANAHANASLYKLQPPQQQQQLPRGLLSANDRAAIDAAVEIAFLLYHCEESDAEAILQKLETEGDINFSRSTGTPANNRNN